MKKYLLTRKDLNYFWFLLFILSFGFSIQLNASHFRGGNIVISNGPGSGLEYDFVVSTLWDRNFDWSSYHFTNLNSPNVGDQINLGGNFPLHFGDGQSTNMVMVVKAIDLVNNVMACEFYASHTYMAPALYTVYFEGMHRESDLQNNDDQPARVEAFINIASSNSTPDLRVPGLDFYPMFATMPWGQNQALMQMTAFKEGTVFLWSLAPAGTFGPGSQQPLNLEITSGGLVKFNTLLTSPGQMYNVALRVTDEEGGYTQLDMIIMIVPCAPEQCNGSDDNCNGQIDEGFPDFDLDGIKNCIDIDDDNDGVPDTYDCEPLNKKKDKWLICHNGKTLCIAKPAVQAHLRHGDELGACAHNNRGVMPDIIDISEDFKLSVAPNPVVSSAIIKYELPVDSKVSIVLFDPQGKAVSTLVDAERKAGQYNYTLYASRLQAGIYYYRMTAISGEQRFVQGQKLMIIK